MEIWKPVRGFEGSYEISNFGKVKSLSRKITLKNGDNRKTKTKIMSPIMYGKYYGITLIERR